jgi:ribokinase
MTKPIVVVGSINLDLVSIAPQIPSVGQTVIGTDFQIHPGGKGANQAVAVARLGYPVAMIGRLGSDIFGTQLRAHLENAGVNATSVTMSNGPSGTAVIVVSQQGENSIVVSPGANAAVSPADVEANLSLIRRAGLVLGQLEIPVETVVCLSEICLREQIPLILDPAPACSLPRRLLENVAWFTPNESEAEFYAGVLNGKSDFDRSHAVASLLFEQGCRGVIVKMGSRGVYVAETPMKRHSLPAFKVATVDSTAAGDAFNGAFGVGLMLGKSPRDSANFASAVAAISVTRAGAQPSMPTMAELEAFLCDQSLSL